MSNMIDLNRLTTKTLFFFKEHEKIFKLLFSSHTLEELKSISEGLSLVPEFLTNMMDSWNNERSLLEKQSNKEIEDANKSIKFLNDDVDEKKYEIKELKQKCEDLEYKVKELNIIISSLQDEVENLGNQLIN